jgi:glycosyltransferase involved in cell wall biosynthesis
VKKRVLVCKAGLLAYSETFIKAQVEAYSQWDPVLVGTYRIASGLPLDGIQVRILENFQPKSLLGKAVRRLSQEFSVAPAGCVDRLRRERASLVHVHFATEAIDYWPVIRRLGVPIVITLHGFDINVYREWWENRPLVAFERQFPRRLLELAQRADVHFIAVSEAIKQRAIDYGIPAERIAVCYIGIDLKKFQPSGNPVSQREPQILFVGRMVEKKGGEFLIRALEQVRRVVPDAKLVMAGDGPLLENHRSLARQLGVPVEFLGSVPQSEIRRQIEQSRIFCLPSVVASNGDAEGLGISILEAQACGVPVVTSAFGGSTEGIVDGVTGYAFPERDIPALALHLTRLLSDPQLCESMSRAAPRFVAERFDIQTCTRSLEGLYDQLVTA